MQPSLEQSIPIKYCVKLVKSFVMKLSKNSHKIQNSSHIWTRHNSGRYFAHQLRARFLHLQIIWHNLANCLMSVSLSEHSNDGLRVRRVLHKTWWQSFVSTSAALRLAPEKKTSFTEKPVLTLRTVGDDSATARSKAAFPLNPTQAPRARSLHN